MSTGTENTIDEQLPERLSEDHMALFGPAVAEMMAAKAELHSAEQLYANAQRRHERAGGALQFVMAYLKSRNGMQPGDDIGSDGIIIRDK